ncbi:MAG: strawberry notch C-terminal domain-containing protein, partial [Tabrizicola sp.]
MTYLAAVAPLVPVPSRDPAPAILAVAEALQPDLAQGFQIDALRLRLEMERAFGGSDADGAWDWKLAYEAGEVALVLFLRKFGRALLARAGSPAALLPILARVSGLLPTHTRRSEEMERFQQFSTPLPMGLAALAAAQITARDLVLEPSAGTGLLAILVEIVGGSLMLNELADTRADLLRHLFPGRPVTSFDAAQIDDHLDAGLRPSVILMNPPFSVVANVDAGRPRRQRGICARRLRASCPAGEGAAARLVVESRAGSANLAETAAFMDDQKRILIFSDAGGTGRSYHADLGARNQRLRVHYLLEPGWKADAAIQGLGRTNRTNQAQPPLFRPVATDVKAEKRFLSTIARRLDTLGAITRGQRQTGGQGLFRPEDNLESPYARDALRQLYRRIYRGDLAGCSLGAFEDATGLSLTDDNGLKDDLPPITTFLNRLLALTIDMQAVLFSAFEELLDQRIEGAIAAGVYDLGLETLRAESFRVTDARVIYTHPGSSAETQLLTIAEKRRNTPTSLADALDWLADPKARLLVNSRSGRAAVQVPATSLMLDDGTIEPRLRLIRPTEASNVPANIMEDTHWLEADRAAFSAAWTADLADIPEFSEATLHIVAGLLLPIWKQLPQDETRVYRLQTDDGQRIIGRRVSPT